MTLPALRRDDTRPDWTPEQAALVKRTIAKGCDDDELALFMHICQRTGLDPFAKQIYAIRRWDSKARREVMTPQTSIDGYRLVAERTGRYAPGREPLHTYDDKTKQLATATSFVKKQTPDGTWHEVAATAHYAEYVQTTKEGAPTKFWAQMPHVMLAKVAEALALRRAFPMELSGIYTHEEMAQADTSSEAAPPAALPEPRRASARPPAPVAAEPEVVPVDDEPPPNVDHETGEELTLDSELSDAEKYGKLVSAKEIGNLMGALASAGISTDELKTYVWAQWGIKSRKQLRKVHLMVLAKWIAARREPGEEG